MVPLFLYKVYCCIVAMNRLFFDLIRVSLGIQKELRRTPSAEEWKTLYDLAKKQSLCGICSRGLQVLYKDAGYRDGIPETLFLKWIGFANIIKEKNRIVNKQCVLLKEHFSRHGFNCGIMKGQGLAALYRNGEVDLRLLRQSGDIDVYVEGGRDKVQKHINQLFGDCEYDYKNVHAPFFEDTEVEVHWNPEILMNLFYNYRLQNYWKEHANDLISDVAVLPEGLGEINVPSLAVNRFYILLHTYRHAFDSGVGLRQVMDYYFVLRQDKDTASRAETLRLVKEYGMTKFAAALMWIMQEVFHLEEDYLLCGPDEKEGRFLLNEIMQSGNFGYYDVRVKEIGGHNKLRALATKLQRAPYLIKHYPMEVLWAPVWMLYHFIWKRTVGRLK